MMLETDLQKLIIDAVLANKGMAHKMSHRFLVGVVDLLIKLPGCSAAIAEVKLAKYNPNIAPSFKVKLDVTHLQERFMLNYAHAGMSAVIISGVQLDRMLRLACIDLDTARGLGYTLTIDAHAYNGRNPDEIVHMLQETV